MDLFKCLQHFKILVEQKSFTKAARLIEINISALSKRISWLEAYFEAPLIQRTTRDYQLTPFGQKAYQMAISWQDQLNELKSHIVSELKEPQGILKISIPQSLGRALFLVCINQFLKQYPKVNIYIESGNSPYLLFDEKADMAISSVDLNHEKLIKHHIISLSKGVFASPNYLKGKKMPENLDELANYDCIINSRVDEDLQWQFERKKNQQNKQKITAFSLNPRIISTTGTDVVEASVYGMGLCCIAHLVAKPYFEKGELVEVKLRQKPVSAKIYLYQKPSYPNSLVRLFSRFIIEHFNKHQVE